MNLIDIENMKAADLKAHKAEAIEAAKGADHADLAGRYVQARTDAAVRDEKLAEQGVTITSLNEAVMSARERLHEAAQAIEQLKSANQELSASAASLLAQVAEQKQRADRAESLAHARRAAVAEINAIAGRALVEG